MSQQLHVVEAPADVNVDGLVYVVAKLLDLLRELEVLFLSPWTVDVEPLNPEVAPFVFDIFHVGSEQTLLQGLCPEDLI